MAKSLRDEINILHAQVCSGLADPNRILILYTLSAQRYNVSDLARAIGVSRKTVSTIEVGRFVPSTVIALKIARYFRVPVEEIFSLPETNTA